MREREREHMVGGAEGETERGPPVDSPLSVEPDPGLNPKTLRS